MYDSLHIPTQSHTIYKQNTLCSLLYTNHFISYQYASNHWILLVCTKRECCNTHANWHQSVRNLTTTAQKLLVRSQCVIQTVITRCSEEMKNTNLGNSCVVTIRWVVWQTIFGILCKFFQIRFLLLFSFYCRCTITSLVFEFPYFCVVNGHPHPQDPVYQISANPCVQYN